MILLFLRACVIDNAADLREDLENARKVGFTLHLFFKF